VLKVPAAIRVQNLSKRYRIRHDSGVPYRTLRDEIVYAAAAPLRWMRGDRVGSAEEFWALKDLSFEVQPGEVVGVIGRNGAGKSTLLKILSRVTKPTSGRVELRGRIGSLLEVGTGFHPELTGRENIFLSGAVLGMARREIARKFDEIVAFADVEKFLDTPVKRYSTGMYMRLAFSVAAHLEPDLLIIDEVLAVGDGAFQEKCLGKVRQVAERGRTVLFVSHSMPAVEAFCEQVVWIEKGRLREIGPPQEIVPKYTASSSETTEPVAVRAPRVAGQYCQALSARVEVGGETFSGPVRRTDEFQIVFYFWNGKPDAYLDLCLALYNAENVCVFTSSTESEPNWHGRCLPTGEFRSSCTLPACLLNAGNYRASLLLVGPASSIEAQYDDLLRFDVLDDLSGRGNWFGEWPGVIRPNLPWRTEFISGSANGYSQVAIR
jgi:lipopolysaccharide transport system ATP-binding protein